MMLVMFGCGIAAGSATTEVIENTDAQNNTSSTLALKSTSGNGSDKDASNNETTCTLPTPASPEVVVDNDGDGISPPIDCDDYNEYTYPGAYELCDYQDNDCNGQTDEVWQEIFGDLLGKPCKAVGLNGCVADGIWSCDFTRDWIACNASPLLPDTEKCNGVDDDCNGVTDTDAWPELGQECYSTKDGCTRVGVWACDNYMLDTYCTAEDKPTTPENCDPDGGN